MQKLYNEDNANIDLSQLEKGYVNNKDLDYALLCNEIRDGIKRLKKNKQPGIDLIYNEFIIYGKDILLLPIVNLFNKILSTGIFSRCMEFILYFILTQKW